MTNSRRGRGRPVLAMLGIAAALALLAGCASLPPAPRLRDPLQIDVFTAGDSGYAVTSTIIYGPHEALLVDAQFTHDDANRLADRIASLRRKVTTIFVTHPDADHFLGLGPLHERFPDARIYMTPAAIAAYRQDVGQLIADMKRSKRPAEAPPAEPLATALPATRLTVDGTAVEIIPDLQGDYAGKPLNSVVWVPSIKALIAGDMAFDKVHLWLDKSTPATRAQWQADVARLQALHARVVVAGHRRDPAAPLAPAILDEDRAYLQAFETEARTATSAEAFESAVRARFADWAHPLFLKIAARSIFATKKP